MRTEAEPVPRALLRRFSRIPGWTRFGIPVGFAIAVAPVFLLVGHLVVRAEQDAAIDALMSATEIQNASLARTLANAHADALSYVLAFDVGDAPEILPVVLRRSGLDEQLRGSIRDTPVSNIKLYDGRGITLFSMHEGDLGEDVSACACFAEVLDNGTFSELVLRGDPTENVGSKYTHEHIPDDFDILSTLVRVSTIAPDIVADDAVLEIQSDVSDIVATIASTRLETAKAIGLPLALLYLAVVTLATLGHLAIIRHDRRAAEMALRAAESEASNRASTEFLSLMSHELRTPLTAIIGFSQLIRDSGQASGETTTYADTIDESGQHMLRLVSTLLDVTALELGEFEIDREPLDLNEVIRAAADGIRPTFDKSLVALDLKYDHAPGVVFGDRERLIQVFENILSNGARFTPAGGTVEVRCRYRNGSDALVTITDDGVGMTREQIERARLPFKPNWDGYARKTDGVGLGLTIADRIVTMLGGGIEIESAVGVGTTIEVRLPIGSNLSTDGEGGVGGGSRVARPTDRSVPFFDGHAARRRSGAG